jgi:hypothetical protein
MSSIAAYYQIYLRDTSYNVVAIFDAWENLSYTKKVNGVGSYSFSINANDDRVDLFELDGIVEIKRQVPALGLTWYTEFMGLHRSDDTQITEEGKYIFTSYGVGLIDLIYRTDIYYKEGTIRAYKNIAAETAMKEYVLENCGASATIANGRENDGVLPDFLVEADGATGVTWEGDRAFENLLDVLQSISLFASMDFDVIWEAATGKFTFKTYLGQIGLDRTVTGLVAATGLNAAGNAPVVFSVEKGNVKSITTHSERISESNIVAVLGEGDGATRTVHIRTDASYADSPWNRREIARSKNGYTNEMEVYGDEVLKDTKYKETVDMTPLLQESCMYGIHFFLGDLITATHKGIQSSKKIMEVSNNVKDTDSLSFTFSDVA